MSMLKQCGADSGLTLHAKTAADLMTANPVSIHEGATVHEAAAFLARRGISAAPVINRAGRPVGVVSRTDLLHHQGQGAVYVLGLPGSGKPAAAPQPADDSRNGGSGRPGGSAAVRDVMTPVIFSVHPESSAAAVVEKMVALKVRRLFVVGEDGVLVGVISAFDVLQRLGW